MYIYIYGYIRANLVLSLNEICKVDYQLDPESDEKHHHELFFGEE